MSEQALIAEATAFVEQVLGTKLNDFAADLKDGVLLCNMLNKLKPGSVPAPKKSKMAFMCMENIAAYLDACRRLGVEDRNNFVTVDLWDAGNLKQVALNITTLKRQLGFGFDKVAKPQVAVEVADDQTTEAVARSRTASQKTEGCRECTRAITAGIVSLNIGGTMHHYHPKCLICKKCSKTLREAEVKIFQDVAYCEKCIHIVNPQTSVRGKVKEMGLKFK